MTYTVLFLLDPSYKTENNIYCKSQILRCGWSVHLLLLRLGAHMRNASLSSACNMSCSHFSIPFPGSIHSFSNIAKNQAKHGKLTEWRGRKSLYEPWCIYKKWNFELKLQHVPIPFQLTFPAIFCSFAPTPV